MKCIKKDGKIKRIRDKQARELVENEGWTFIPKSEWKSNRKRSKSFPVYI